MSSSVGIIVIEWVEINNVPNHLWASHPYALAPPRSQPSKHTCVPNHQPETLFPTEWVKINVLNIFQTNNHQPSKTIKHNKQTIFSNQPELPDLQPKKPVLPDFGSDSTQLRRHKLRSRETSCHPVDMLRHKRNHETIMKRSSTIINHHQQLSTITVIIIHQSSTIKNNQTR